MTDHNSGTEDAVAEHATDSHMDAHTALSDDDHGHAEEALGPIDWRGWGLALLGALSGVVVLAGFWIALN
jgi:hypothetical protein